MVVKICPNCNRRYISESGKDVIHVCNSGNTTLDQEDVLITGDWEDYTGEGEEQNVNMKGIGNQLFGTTASIEGEKFDGVTKRGRNKLLYRQRQHEEFIS